MKTSNKLLIAFAAFLLIMPILVMAIYVKLNYTDKGQAIKSITKEDQLSTPIPGFARKTIAQPFQSVNIADARGMTLQVHLIKDSKSGIKISEELKDLIRLDVDGNGRLQIGIDEEANLGYNMRLNIYAPDINQFSVSKSNGLELTTLADSLSLNVKNSGYLFFGGFTKIGQLNLTADQVDNLSVKEGGIESLNLNMKDTKFNSKQATYKSLTISASGKSSVKIYGDEELKQRCSIDQLVLNTFDQAELEIQDMHVNTISGSLSDDTKVNMPIIYLKQIMK